MRNPASALTEAGFGGVGCRLPAALLSDRRKSATREFADGQHREITDEKQAQATLRENEEQYRFNLLEAANLGTWEWDIATGEDRWSANMESIHGMPPTASAPSAMA